MARKPKTKTEENLEAVTVQHEARDTGLEGQEFDSRSRCGGALRTHREQQGLSVQTVASRLRLSTKQIEALEADNFDALPEATIARGFIRNYAKLLGISAEPLLDAYNVLVPSKAPHSFTVAPAPYAAAGKQYRDTNLKRWMPLFILALLGLGAWLFYQSYIQKPNPIAPTANSLPAPEALPPVALPAGERQTETATPQSTTTELVLPPAAAPEPTSATATTQVTTETAPAQPAAPVAAPMPPVPAAGEPAALPASTSKLSRLEFSATQETWVSVTDASGKEIYNKILFAGNREVVEAAPPLNVVVGNANGTSLSVNGVETNLGPHTKVNVARIKVE